jgi:hypothetical protein
VAWGKCDILMIFWPENASNAKVDVTWALRRNSRRGMKLEPAGEVSKGDVGIGMIEI